MCIRDRVESERPYFYKTQVEKVEAIKRFLTEHVAENFTQEELSSRFDIAMTPMKTCFRSVYGAAIGTWLKNYRMNLAAELLLKEKGLNDVLVIGGGVIPDADIPGLKAAGIAEVFTPGTPTSKIVDFINANVK